MISFLYEIVITPGIFLANLLLGLSMVHPIVAVVFNLMLFGLIGIGIYTVFKFILTA